MQFLTIFGSAFVYFLLAGVHTVVASTSGSLQDRKGPIATELVHHRQYEEGRDDDSEITLVSTVDGYLHAVDAKDNPRWSLDTGGPLTNSHHSSEARDFAVLPTSDGSILIHSKDGMQKTSVKARMLAEKAPFVSHRDGLVFTGQKSSRLLGVDVLSGKVVHDSDTQTMRSVAAAQTQADPLSGSQTPVEKMRRPLWVGRTDYTLRAFNQMTGKESFNLTYSELQPMALTGASMYGGLDATTAKKNTLVQKGKQLLPAGKRYEKMPPNDSPERTKLVSTPDGQTYFTDGEGRLYRRGPFLSASAVNAFSVSKQSRQLASSASPESAGAGHGDGGDEIFDEEEEFLVEPLTVSVRYRMLPPVEADPLELYFRNHRARWQEEEQSKGRGRGESSEADGGSASGDILVRANEDGGLYAIEMDALPVVDPEDVDKFAAVTYEDDSKYSALRNKITESVGIDKAKYQQEFDALALPDPADVRDEDTQSSDFSSGSGSRSGDLSDRPSRSGAGGIWSGRLEKQPASLARDRGRLDIIAGHRGMDKKAIKRLDHGKFQSSRRDTGLELLLGDQQDGDGEGIGDERFGDAEEEEEVGREVRKRNDIYVDDDYTSVSNPQTDYEEFARKLANLKYNSADRGEFFYQDGRMCAVYGSQESGLLNDDGSGTAHLPACQGSHRMLPVSPYEVSVLASKLEGDADLPDFLDPSHYSAYGVGLSTAVEEPKPVTVISLFSRILLIIEAMLIRIAAFVAVLMAILYWLNKAGIPIPFPSSVMEKLKLVLQSKLRSFVTGDPSLAMQGLVNIELESQRLAMQLQKQRLGAGAEEEDDMEEFDADGNRVQRVGSLMLSSHVLGYGSQGTVVFKGCLNGRPVAVKRMLAQFSRAAEREMNLLIRSDGHANVVRYFLKEQKGEFVYLALQLCKMSLRDFVLKLQRHQNSTQAALRASAAAGNNAYAALGSTGSSKVPGAKTSSSGSVTVDEIPEEARLALLQIAEGVAHLHSQRIVHRDIKPHNILCALPDDQIERNEGGELLPATITTPRQLGDFILKISDMGLSKQLDREEDSFASMSMPFPHLAASTTMPSNGSSLSADEGGDGSGAGGDKQADNSPVGTIGWQAPELMALRGTGAIPEEEEEDDDEDEDVDEDAAEDECDSDGARQAPEHSNGIENASDCSTTMTGAAAASSSSSSSSVAAKNESSPEDSMPAINGDAHGRGVGVNVGVESDNIPLKSIKNANRRSLVDQRRDRRRRTQTVDIFSLGCVFHYVLVPGVHPFGQWFEREPNIMTGKANLMQLKLVPDALDLIERMLQKEPSDRPSAAEVCKHPFFWSAQKRLDFFVELSDFLEHESVNAPVVIAMEANGSAVVGRSWDRKLHASLLEDMNRYRKYDTASVRDLLRVIRNKRHHFHELTDSVKHVVGNMPAGFVSYFESRFPTLIMHCVRVACQYLSQEKDIKPFCGGITGLFESKDKDRDGSRVLQEMASGDGDTRGNGPTAGGHGSSSSGSTSNHPRGDDGAGLTADAAAGAGAGPVQSEDSIAETHAHLLASGVVVWQGSAIAASSQCRGWWRESSTWTAPPTTTRHRPQHVTRSATDPRYRSRLCTHWEGTEGTSCPMRKKGKCDFAHGPLELRVKESRRDKWALRSSSGVGLAGDLEGQLQCGPCSSGSGSGSGLTAAMALRMSGGEDVLGAARSIEKVRAAEGSISEFERTSVNRKHHQQTPRKR